MDRSSGDSRPTDPPALPLDLRHTAILLEARRHFVAAKIRNPRLDSAAEHLCIPTHIAARLPNHRPDVLWLLVALGPRVVPRLAAAATLALPRLGQIPSLLSRIPPH